MVFTFYPVLVLPKGLFWAEMAYWVNNWCRICFFSVSCLIQLGENVTIGWGCKYPPKQTMLFLEGSMSIGKLCCVPARDPAKLRAWAWINAKGKGRKFSYYEWEMNPRACLNCLVL